MKIILIWFIGFYQFIVSPFIHAITGGSSGCRYVPSCSEYAKEVISQKGVGKGVPLAIKRILSCHPFAKIQNTI